MHQLQDLEPQDSTSRIFERITFRSTSEKGIPYNEAELSIISHNCSMVSVPGPMQKNPEGSAYNINSIKVN